MRSAKKAITVLLSLCLVFYAMPARAETLTTSNGVSVRQLNSHVSSNSSPRAVAEHEVTWQGESAWVVTTEYSPSYATIEFEGVLFEYYFSRNSNNEKRVDRIDVTFNGVTKSLTGDGYYYTHQPCEIDQPCDSEMHMTAEGQDFLNFVYSALLSVNSASFYNALDHARNEVSSNGWVSCGASVVGYIGSFAGFVTCPSVIGCVGAIVLHKIAVAGLICSCATDC